MIKKITKKNEVKTRKRTFEEEHRRIITESQLKMVLEDFNEKFETIKEGTDAKLDKIHNELRDFRIEMYAFKDETEKKFKIILEYLSRIDDEIQEIKADIKDLKESKAEKKKIINLEKRINSLESEVEFLRAKVAV